MPMKMNFLLMEVTNCKYDNGETENVVKRTGNKKRKGMSSISSPDYYLKTLHLFVCLYN